MIEDIKATIRHNGWKKVAIVAAARVPLMLPLALIAWLGNKAEDAGDWLSPKLPHLEEPPQE